jgi:cysteine-rich repeat protein
MRWMPSTGTLLIALAAWQLTTAAPTAHAERLFEVAEGMPAPGAHVSRVRTLVPNAAAMASLRAQVRATLTEFPLGVDGSVTLEVERFEPFTADARAVVVEAGGTRDVPLPDQRYFRGAVAGEPTSKALVIVGDGQVSGFVETAAGLYRFGPDDTGIHRSYALADADPASLVPPANLLDDAVEVDAADLPADHAEPEVGALPQSSGLSEPLGIEVAIDTDQEFRAKFASDGAALAYVASLAANVSAIYDRDTGVRISFNSIRLWNTADPWSATNTATALSEVQSYWLSNGSAIERDVVHFLSGKPLGGGRAYLNVLCNASSGYGVSELDGSFNVLDPAATWDIVVVAHELGHNVGSRHTHCYSPPLDACYGGESGCYAGPTSLPPGGGTIMSYCHTLPGGMRNISLTFGATVSGVLRAGVERASCVDNLCGNGRVDPGEWCDDGNHTSGDCCSSTCTLEFGPCDDGEACTLNDWCQGGGQCRGFAALDGTACDDGSSCTVDTCQRGTCVGEAVPATSCRVPVSAGRSTLLVKDRTPDTGDQLVWKWSNGTATSFADFGDPLATDDYELCVYTPGPTLFYAGRMNGGAMCGSQPCWKTDGVSTVSYSNRARTPNGMEKLSLRAGTTGSAKAAAKGKGANLSLPPLDVLYRPVRVQLRGAGQCWEATYSTAGTATSAMFKAASD